MQAWIVGVLACLLGFAFLPAGMLDKPAIGQAASRIPAPRVDFVPYPGLSGAGDVYQARGLPGAARFSADGMRFDWIGSAPGGGARRRSLRIAFLAGLPAARLHGFDLLPSKASYFLGTDPEKWAVNLPVYGGIRYQALYPGIDLLIGGVDGEGATIERTYEVSPGANPAAILWRYRGVRALWVDPAGDLHIELPGGDMLVESAPRAWQLRDGRAVPIEAAYRVTPEGDVGFELGPYHPAYPLTIDPVLSFSTLLGGGLYDEALGVAIDAARNIYLVGSTLSMDFPVDFPPAPELQENRNIFVVKLSREEGNLESSVVLGGSGEDVGRALAIDLAGDVFITGSTNSIDFPTTRPPQVPEESGENVFVLKLSVSGGVLRYAHVFGGAGSEVGQAIAVDGSGSAFLAGRTDSTDFPTASPLQPGPGGGEADAFVAKLNPLGTEFEFSTYLGGDFFEEALGLAVDRTGSVYVTGVTDSAEDFPLHEPYQDAMEGFRDAFVTRLVPDGGGFVFSTFLGLGETTAGQAVALDRDGGVLIAGAVSPLSDEEEEGSSDAFLARLSPEGEELTYQRQLGGGGDDEAFALAVDRAGNVFVTGATDSPDLAVDGSLQAGYGGNGDAFLAQVDPAGNPVTSNYLGGSGFDAGYGIAVDGVGNAVVAGLTFSSDFPTLTPLQSGYAGDGDVFVLRIEEVEFVPTPVPTDPPPPPPPTPEPTAVPGIIDTLVESNNFLYGVAGLIVLLFLLIVWEMFSGGRRR